MATKYDVIRSMRVVKARCFHSLMLLNLVDLHKPSLQQSIRLQRGFERWRKRQKSGRGKLNAMIELSLNCCQIKCQITWFDTNKEHVQEDNKTIFVCVCFDRSWPEPGISVLFSSVPFKDRFRVFATRHSTLQPVKLKSIKVTAYDMTF